MFIVIISDTIIHKTWPLVSSGRVCLFKSVQSAHEYMKKELGGREQPNSRLSGGGTYYHNEKCRSGKYEIQEVKIIELPVAQEPEPELDPYDGLTPADYGGHP